MTGKRFYNNVNRPFVLIKWKIEANHCIFSGSTVLTYVYQKDFSESKSNLGPKKLKSSVQGIVLNLLVKEGDVVQPGAPLLEFDLCSHQIVLKGICANCGKDTWSSQIFRNFGGTGLTVTKEQAKLLEKAGEDALLRRRKLALLICVDQILIDIKDDKDSLQQKETTLLRSETHGQSGERKLLPGAQAFLERISDTWDIHFFTHGNKSQGLEVAHILIKECQIFPKHVWTKEDFHDLNSNEKKLEVAFPHGYAMVCILDCHEHLWSSDDNIVWVKPYSYFLSTENVKDATQLIYQQTKSIATGETEETTENKTENALNETDDTKLLETAFNAIKNASNDTDDTKLLDSANAKKDPQNSDTDHGPECSLLSNMCPVKNNCGNKKSFSYYENFSNYMSYLKTILHNIHKGYYHLLDEMICEQMYVIHQQVIPHLKFVIPYIRKSILKGVNVVFSGIIPKTVDPTTCPFWVLAESLGASVSNDLTLDDNEAGTTHIIAAKFGTNKLHDAKRCDGIFIVTIDWLYDCAFRWDHVSEKDFLLRDNSLSEETPTPVDSELEVIPSLQSGDSVQKNEDLEDNSSNQTPNPSSRINLDLTSEDLDNMAKEVENEISTDDSDDERDMSSNRLATIKRKIRDKWDFHPVSDFKRQRHGSCTPLGVGSATWCEDESSNVSFPEWEVPCDSDSDIGSETESPMVDYIWSEDEDTLLSNTGSNFSDL